MMSSWLERHLPKIIISPSFAAILVFVYGFIGWTVALSLTKSKILPNFTFAGLFQYERLFAMDRWHVALSNLIVFMVLFVGIAIALGLLLAIFLDQKIRGEGVIRSVYLYPMALSFIVTGTAWKWLLNPGLGFEKVIHDLGFQGFHFDWLVNEHMAIYTIVIAAVWQSAGFAMALFLAGLRSINPEIIRAAMVEGAGPWRIYLQIVIPNLRATFFSSVIVLLHIAIKSFDLVVALTAGGPGYSTDMPATFMYTMAFGRGELGLAAASATIMLMTVLAVIVPYLYSELRGDNER